MNVVGTTFFFHFSAGGHRSCYAALLNREVKRRDTLRKPSFQFTIASDRGFELSIVMVRSILSLQSSLAPLRWPGAGIRVTFGQK